MFMCDVNSTTMQRHSFSPVRHSFLSNYGWCFNKTLSAETDGSHLNRYQSNVTPPECSRVMGTLMITSYSQRHQRWRVSNSGCQTVKHGKMQSGEKPKLEIGAAVAVANKHAHGVRVTCWRTANIQLNSIRQRPIRAAKAQFVVRCKGSRL